MTTAPALDTTGWQVPSYDSFIFHERRHRYALVVPVINEGERIRAQLVRTAAADLPVDVIIADGGSTDGSLDHDFMKRVGVRALLIKTGAGRLSAQLRMAYSWCLTEGYQGIVTIDGNNKDNVEAVADFVAKLDESYDYVQGSRYTSGGRSVNTPLDRTIGNRLIHAPLLSVASRHWFTDTTNGFRAYSAEYLLDPRVAPFRDQFIDYELLFYLTLRAAPLGHKICQLPVTRTYPKNAPTPTKIGSVASKFRLFQQLLKVISGAYSPK